MNIDTIVNDIALYGYLTISILLFFGIVGIPAPEESLLFFLGVLIVQGKLSFVLVLICSILGAFVGMLVAYGLGRYIGYPFIRKFGKYIGISNNRWEKAQEKYNNNAKKTILFGFYMPGVRQISPYFAGINNIPLGVFTILSFFGTILWTTPYILAGYYTGQAFHINLKYVPLYGMFVFVLFFAYYLMKLIKRKINR